MPPLPEALMITLDEFHENNNFVNLYKSYSWGKDKWDKDNGFEKIFELEKKLSIKAYRGGLEISDLEWIRNWGQTYRLTPIINNIDGRVNFDRRFYCDQNICKKISFVFNSINGFGITYSSKVLRFILPKEFGAIDSRIVKVFGNQSDNPWFNLATPNAGGAIIQANQWEEGYQSWIDILYYFSSKLGNTCPHPNNFTKVGLRNCNVWTSADVEMALFVYASNLILSGNNNNEEPGNQGENNMGHQGEIEDGGLIELPTWAGRSQFNYEGSVEEGTIIYFGNNQNQQVTVTADHYNDLLAEFNGRLVAIGTSRDNPPAGSVGAWLQNNVTGVAIASYIGAILVSEGYAERDNSNIRFNNIENE